MRNIFILFFIFVSATASQTIIVSKDSLRVYNGSHTQTDDCKPRLHGSKKSDVNGKSGPVSGQRTTIAGKNNGDEPSAYQISRL